MDLLGFFFALLNLPVLFTNIFGFRLVGLTGGIATGKSTTTRLIKSMGVPVIDFDLIAREVVTPGSSCLKSIAAAFGPTVLAADGSLDRGVLGEIIFNDKAKRTLLNSIMQRPIMLRFLWLCVQFFFLGKIPSHLPFSLSGVTPQATHGIFTSSMYPGLEQPFGGSRVVVLDCPLLFESGIYQLCSSTVYIHCSAEVQLQRLQSRDNLTPEQAQARIAAQWGTETKLSLAKHVIHNNGDQAALYKQLVEWFFSLTQNRFGIVLSRPRQYHLIQSLFTPPIQDPSKTTPKPTKIPIDKIVDHSTAPSFFEQYHPRNFCIIPTMLSCLFTVAVALPSYFVIRWIDHGWFSKKKHDPVAEGVTDMLKKPLNSVKNRP